MHLFDSGRLNDMRSRRVHRLTVVQCTTWYIDVDDEQLVPNRCSCT